MPPLWATFDQHAEGADVLVNNAGVVVYGRVNEVVEEDFDRLFAVNVKAVLFIIQHGLHRLRDGARIINVSSAGAYMASPMATMYTMTKGAVSTLTRTLAWDLGERHISVNAVAPGFTDTEMNLRCHPTAEDPGRGRSRPPHARRARAIAVNRPVGPAPTTSVRTHAPIEVVSRVMNALRVT